MYRSREPLKIHFGKQANLSASGRRQTNAALASTKAGLSSLPENQNLLLVAQKQLLELPLILLIIVVAASSAWAESGRSLVEQGNQLYAEEQFDGAIEKYTLASEDIPQSPVPEFNKANSLYKLGSFQDAIEYYKQVAADSSDKKMVSAAKYNLGNSFFQKALKNQQTEPEKTLEDMKTSIGYFRDVLDVDSDNRKAAQNIEVAKAAYKQIKEQQQQDQQQENNEGEKQGDQQQDDQQQQGDQDQSDQQQDQQQNQQQQQGQEPSDQQQQPQEPQEQPMRPDATAQQILDKEKHQKKERQILQSLGLEKVEKDW